jgi:hypothetical protein
VLGFESVTPPGSDPEVIEKVPLPVPFDVAILKVNAEFMVPVSPVVGVVIATALAVQRANKVKLAVWPCAAAVVIWVPPLAAVNQPLNV